MVGNGRKGHGRARVCCPGSCSFVCARNRFAALDRRTRTLGPILSAPYPRPHTLGRILSALIRGPKFTTLAPRPLIIAPRVRPSCRLFWADRIVEKARNWFNRAVKLDPDNGDAWAYFLKFEIEQGTDETRQDVIARTVQAEPRHGLVWPTVAKAVGNARKTPEEILALTAAALDNA